MANSKTIATKIISIIFILLILFAALAFVITINKWSKVEITNVNCQKANYLKLKDVEGNTFIFTDTPQNSNLKTNNITFNEKNLGIKSLAKITNSNTSLNYLSKNDKITYEELINLQECYKTLSIKISNNYNFEKALENKFCNFVVKNNNDYEISLCE